VNTLTITASNTTAGEVATSAPQAIVVTDPPIASANTAIAPPMASDTKSGSDFASMDRLAVLMDQYIAAGFHGLAGRAFCQADPAQSTFAASGPPSLLSASHSACAISQDEWKTSGRIG
jgi:hypothetical protein